MTDRPVVSVTFQPDREHFMEYMRIAPSAKRISTRVQALTAGWTVLFVLGVGEYGQTGDGLYGVILGVVFAILYIRSLARLRQRAETMTGLLTLEFDEDGMRRRTDDSDSRFRWEHIDRWIETRAIIGVGTKPSGVEVIPRSSLSPSELELLKGFLYEKVGSPAVAEP